MLRARELGFDEIAAGRVGLVVTEAGTNIAKHGGGDGAIVIGTVTTTGTVAVEIIAMDCGPGIRDLPRSMADGFSTGGSPGTGLGAIRRQSGFVDIHSDETGTVLLARIWPGRTPTAGRWRVGAICLPLESEPVSGDIWSYTHDGDRATFLLVDGLGHGRLAHDAAKDAIRALKDHPSAPAIEILDLANRSARGTRGAAAAAAGVDLAQGMLTYCGLGNISGSLVTRQGTSRSMISQHGILGADQRRIQPFHYPWNGMGVLVMHSDGLQTRWDLSKYPGLLARDPGVIASVLYRDHARGRDDVSVVVATTDPA